MARNECHTSFLPRCQCQQGHEVTDNRGDVDLEPTCLSGLGGCNCIGLSDAFLN